MAYKTIVEEGIDILVVGAGLGGTGAAWEARFWGQNKKIVIAENAEDRLVDDGPGRRRLLRTGLRLPAGVRCRGTGVRRRQRRVLRRSALPRDRRWRLCR